MRDAVKGRRSAWAMRWLPALVVAFGAAVATAHGLYEVAAAAGVPTVIAWLYPLITDGLALVAYAATARLAGRSAGYAWGVVVLTAALSGLAQAAYLAAGDLQADTVVRFGVGAWPAVAIALVAHLLHLLAAATPSVEEPAAPERVLTSPPLVASEPLASTELTAPEVHEHDEQPFTEDDTPSPAETVDVPPEPETDPRVIDLAHRCAAGEQLTGQSVGDEFTVSDRTGRRLIAEARVYLEEHPELTSPATAPTPRPDLHLVGQSTAGGTA